jgi:hypothetical protein
MRLTLDNRLGAYNRGPHSPNHPFVRRGVPVRVSVNLGENLDNAALPGRAPGAFPGRALVAPQRTFRPRFLGFADGSPRSGTCRAPTPPPTLEASGVLRRLGQGSAPLSSPARRSISHLPGLLAYWPLEDDKFAVTAASALDRGPAMAVADGLPVFAAAKATNFSDPVMQVHDAVLVGQVPNYVDTGQLQFRFMMSMTDEGVYSSDVADLVTFYTTGSVNKWTISLGQTVLPGTFVLIGRSTGATPNVVTIPDNVDSGIGQIIDKPTLVSIDLTQVGADFNLKLWYHYPGDAFVLYYEKTVSSQTFGKITRVVVHGNPVTVGALDHAFLGHVYARSVVSPGSDLRKAFGGDAGETTAERLTRLCSDASIPLTVHGASSLLMGQQTSRKLLDLIQECEETEQGVLVDGIDQGLTFFTYAHRRNRDAALTIDVARSQVAKELTPVDDDQQTRNKWEVKRDGGGSTTVEDADGPMGTGVIGIYDSSLSVSTNSEDRLGDYAGWLVHLGTFDGYRYPQISFDLAKNPELAGAWVDVLPTDHIAVTNARTRRTQLPDDTLGFVVGWVSGNPVPVPLECDGELQPAVAVADRPIRQHQQRHRSFGVAHRNRRLHRPRRCGRGRHIADRLHPRRAVVDHHRRGLPHHLRRRRLPHCLLGHRRCRRDVANIHDHRAHGHHPVRGHGGCVAAPRPRTLRRATWRSSAGGKCPPGTCATPTRWSVPARPTSPSTKPSTGK